MAVDTIQNVESYIRDLAKDRRCRFSENFLDFDKLRSGFVTAGQFFRVLNSLIGVNLPSSSQQLILEKYGANNNAEVDWRRFVREMEGIFDPADFSESPECKMMKTINSPAVGTKSEHIRPGDEDFDKLRPILSRINQFIKFQGFIIRDCYKQFDVHNMGVVSETQFYRSFPGPADITVEELTTLVQRYKSLTSPGFVDYLSFENDLKKLAAAEEVAKLGVPPGKTPDEAVPIPEPKEDFLRPSLNMIIDRIRFAVHRRGIRVMEFFVDYDKLRHDEITENQFACALLLAIGKEAQLTRAEVQMLVNNNRSEKDRNLVHYREFCRQVDSPFHILDLEKDPLKQPIVFPPGALSRGLPSMEESEEQRVSELIEQIRAKVEKERILTYPTFRDFDLGTGNSRIITASQFARVLHILGIDVSSEDCRRLCRKFSDPTTGEVNYPTFCQAVDSWFTASVPIPMNDLYAGNPPTEEDAIRPAIGETKCGKGVVRKDWSSTTVPTIRSAGDNLPVDVLLDRIRHLVLTSRIQLKPWFYDFDGLRSGYMTRTRFERCLTMAGLTRLDLHDLTPAQVQTITDAYASSEDPNMVNWRKFVEDVDSVFTLPELEKQPLTRVMPLETYVQPRPGTADWESATVEMKDIFEKSMSKLRRIILERRMLLLPDFLAFDRHHRGVVTLNNFRQLASMFNFSLTGEEIDAIVARYGNDVGFEYRKFLDDLDPPTAEETEYRYPKRLESLQKVNILGKQRRELEPVIKDTEGVLEVLKADVYRRRLRLADCFRDHDKLNHGYLPRTTFRRCLGSLLLKIGETGMSMVEDRYKGPLPETINWREFCKEIEHVFQTPDLEKDPLKEPETYVPDSMVAQNYLSLEVAKTADDAITKIADKVRQRRLQLLPMFSDFDETHRMTVSQNQFRRVLMTLDLHDMLTEKEMTCLYWKYRHPLGVVDNINYQAFIDDVYTRGGLDPRLP
ncbi:unnamed protein product [Calicophoron daubneyi]|uniref:Uncharacterized protein n=1 Tax=Calicophoron daubneyi TaxID=300641 RepID=A0AAV2TZN6_CALDB